MAKDDRCQHGPTWDENCAECDASWTAWRLERLEKDAASLGYGLVLLHPAPA
jgi:hypothetical protein